MNPLTRAALALAAFAVAGRLAGPRPLAATAAERGGAKALHLENSGAPAEPAAACPSETLPDLGVCVPVPSDEVGGEALMESANAHRDRRGALRQYDQIPRRPDRPEDFTRYRLPIPAPAGRAFVGSGYDLDRPDSEQRRGPGFSAVGHGGVDLAQARGTRVTLIRLENQVGDADVLHVGPLFGNSVVTHHSVREGGVLRDYLIVFGHLEGAAPGLRSGTVLRTGDLVGFVGDSGSPGIVHLHLEVRRAREGVQLSSLAPGELTQNAKTVACDPRNVLELLPSP